MPSSILQLPQTKASEMCLSFDSGMKKRKPCDVYSALPQKSRAAKRGGFKQGGFPIWTCPSFFVLFCPFWDFPDFSGIFPDLLGDGPGIFPICPFPLSRPIKSTYEEQSRKGPRHNLDLSRKKWGNPPVWKAPGLASLSLKNKKKGTFRNPQPLVFSPKYRRYKWEACRLYK